MMKACFKTDGIHLLPKLPYKKATPYAMSLSLDVKHKIRTRAGYLKDRLLFFCSKRVTEFSR